MKEKRYFEVECNGFVGQQIIASSHEKAVKKFLTGKNPKYWATLARVREDHPRKSRRKWFYISPELLFKKMRGEGIDASDISVLNKSGILGKMKRGAA